jgi:hypothetical protein
MTDLHDDRKGNWIAVSRNLFDNDCFKQENFTEREAFLWMIMHAAWQTKTIKHKGKPQKLERGQLLGGSEHLAKTFGWSRQRVRTFLAKLQREEMIEINQRSNQRSNQCNGHYANIVTISNYNKYQTGSSKPNQRNNQWSNQRSNQTLTSKTNKQLVVDDAGASNKSQEWDDLENQLREAAGECLNSASPSLFVLSDVIGWMADGADLQADILPAIRAASRRAAGVSSWRYFAQAVANARDRRKAGLPPPDQAPSARPATRYSKSEWDGMIAQGIAKGRELAT